MAIAHIFMLAPALYDNQNKGAISTIRNFSPSILQQRRGCEPLMAAQKAEQASFTPQFGAHRQAGYLLQDRRCCRKTTVRKKRITAKKVS